MPGVVQRIVDDIGAQVDRSVLVEDPGLRVVAYSEHDRETDTVRRNSILERHTTKDVVAWCRAAGVHGSRTPVRVQRNRDLDFRTRVCVPVHSHGMLLGFVWIIDDNQSLSDEDLSGIDAELASLSEALYAARARRVPPPRVDAPEAAALLDDQPPADEAAGRLLRTGGLESDGPTTVLVLRHGDRALDETQRRALEAFRGRIGQQRTLIVVRDDHIVVLLRTRVDPHHISARLHTTVADRTEQHTDVIGIGSTVPRLADAPRAYREANQAARIATLMPSMGPVAAWSQLGVYRMLAQPGVDGVDVATVHPGLVRLLDGPDANPELVATLEAYLDSAGNAAATSAALHLHRTTLYYRLQRIEQLAGTDLKDGDERLCLHLGLKLSRLRRSASETPSP